MQVKTRDRSKRSELPAQPNRALCVCGCVWGVCVHECVCVCVCTYINPTRVPSHTPLLTRFRFGMYAHHPRARPFHTPHAPRHTPHATRHTRVHGIPPSDALMLSRPSSFVMVVAIVIIILNLDPRPYHSQS
jgi:hypothetical protein